MRTQTIHSHHELSPILIPEAEREQNDTQNRLVAYGIATILSLAAAAYAMVEYNFEHELNDALHARVARYERALVHVDPHLNSMAVKPPIKILKVKRVESDRILSDYPPIYVPTFMAVKKYRYPR